MHGLVGRHCPEGVEVDVDGHEPNHQGESRQLGLEADGHQNDERRTHHVLQDLQEEMEDGSRVTIQEWNSHVYCMLYVYASHYDDDIIHI